MNERRKHKRRHTIFYLKVYDEATGKVAGRLVDITIDGMMLVSEKQIDMSNIFDFRLALPEKINGVDELTLKAKSVWSRADINPDFFDTGYQFVDQTLEDISLIADSFDNLLFDDIK